MVIVRGDCPYGHPWSAYALADWSVIVLNHAYGHDPLDSIRLCVFMEPSGRLIGSILFVLCASSRVN